jgi:hypothetical protein
MSGLEKDLHELSHLFEHLNEENSQFINDFFERKYRPSDLEIHPRVLNNWNINRILPETKKKGWHQFNLTECVYLKIVIHLRSFNLPLSVIEKIKQELLQPLNTPEFIHQNEIMQRLQEAVNNNNLFDLNEIINSDEYKAIMHELELNLLDGLILNLFFTKGGMRILINHEGEIVIQKDRYEMELSLDEEYVAFIKKPHISISLNHIVYEITNQLIEDDDEMHKLKIITDQELKILELIRGKGINKIEITFNNEEKPKMITITKSNKLDTASRIKEILIAGGYEDIKITTENGKVVNCVKTQKIKL